MAGGTLIVPNDFAAKSGNVPASELDGNNSTIETYVNIRQIEAGLLAARPAQGTKGQWFFATDVNGGTLYFDTGSAWQQAAQQITTSRRLTGQLTATGTGANTAETVLQTYTVPAGTLAIAGDGIKVRAIFSVAANANTKTARIRIGTVSLAGTVMIGGDAIALNGGAIVLEAEVVRRTAVTQATANTRWSTDTGIYPSIANFNTLALTLASAFLVEATGQNGTAAANDIVCEYMTVDFITS